MFRFLKMIFTCMILNQMIHIKIIQQNNPADAGYSILLIIFLEFEPVSLTGNLLYMLAERL